MKDELTRLTFDIPKKLHVKLKTKSALTGKSMKKIILEHLECITNEHVPNEETIKALEDIENRKNLIKAKNLKDLFDKLDI